MSSNQSKSRKNSLNDNNSDSDLSVSFEQQQFNRIYTNELKKKQQQIQQNMLKNKNPKQNFIDISHVQQNQTRRNQQNEVDNQDLRSQSRSNSNERQNSRSRSRSRDKQRSVNWHIYDICQTLTLDRARFNSYILHLPIYKKKQQILNNIISNQVVLVTGETGCGKSTQVPRLLYQYIRQTNLPAKIICVQPRRLAVKNLHKILSDQIPEKGAVGYHIAMQTFIKQNTKILFMTNGIFLQRLVHGTQFFNEYPFIVLDQVHQRDIDTDFILLSMKRLMRNHPKLRVILMSATIDNKLFQYYFAQDEVDNFMKRENFYKRFIRLEQKFTKMRQEEQQEHEGYRIQRVGEEDELYKKIQLEYLNAKLPCPTVNVTQKGKYKKQYYYLDTLNNFIKRSYCQKWGSVGFMQKSPSTNKQLYETACVIMEQILIRSPKDKSNQSVLIFLPGLGEIQFFASEMRLFFGKRIDNFQIVKCHSSILNDQTTKKLHQIYKDKFKIIIATNIAQSSITVYGVKYIIDFCLSKQINFNQKSRMQNLELVWASKASCQQRAGRTGRVCDGLVFRMVEQAFYRKLPDYSTPQIQRSSLDKLILRIKLIHQNEAGKIFEDPGQVLGTAIQPPNLKHIDQAIKALVLCGGLKVENQKLILTKLGRIYVDIPLDIIYSKMLIFSMLMGTFDDTLILVCVLSQNKNAFRKTAIQKFPLQYFQIMTNDQRCDFVALINAYKNRQNQYSNHYRNKGIQLDIYYQTKLLLQDVSRRIRQRNFAKKIYPDQSKQDHQHKLKMTLAFGFLSNLMKARTMIYDDKQEKRYKLMKKQGTSVHNTVILLNSDVIRKSADNNQNADQRMKQNWIQNISQAFRIKAQNMNMTLGHGISFLHFKQQTDLNKFLFIKFIQKKRASTNEQKNRSSNRTLTLSQILPHLGDVDYMEQGNIYQLLKDHKVTIDSYSSNRVVAVSKQNQSFQFPQNRLLMTNSITQHSSRLGCRFSSLLPDIPNLQAILHLAFYPFVTLIPDRKKTRYEAMYLKKKNKVYINYELTDEEVFKANQIRQIIKELLDLSLFLQDQVDFDNLQPVRVTQEGRIIEDMQELNVSQYAQNIQQENVINFQNDKILPTIRFQQRQKNQMVSQNQIKKQQSQASLKRQQRIHKMKKFWPLLKSFIITQRKPIIQQQKWQQLYFKQKQISQNAVVVKHQKQEQKQYMNQIRTIQLRFSFFSSNFQSNNSRESRISDYQKWKMEKYRQVVELQNLALDHDPYLICAQCNVKIAKLNKVGPINNQYFRQLFQYIQQNVQKLVYNQLGDYFCSMIMTIYIQKQYEVYGCKNGHYLALKFKDQKKLKILTFSPLNILYTDQTIDVEPQFEAMQYKIWRQRFQQSKLNKMKKPAQQNFCFVCGQKFKTVKQIETHVKNQYHEANMRDFKTTLSLMNENKKADKMNGVYLASQY